MKAEKNLCLVIRKECFSDDQVRELRHAAKQQNIPRNL